MDGPAAELADALASGRELDLRGAALPAALLAEVLTAPPPPGAPVLRLRRAAVNGVLRLVGAQVARAGGAARLPVHAGPRPADGRVRRPRPDRLPRAGAPGGQPARRRGPAAQRRLRGPRPGRPHRRACRRLAAAVRGSVDGGRRPRADRRPGRRRGHLLRAPAVQQRGAAAAGRAHHRQHRPRGRRRHEPDRRRGRPHRHRRRRQPAGRPPRRRSRPRLRRRRPGAARRRADRRGPDVLRRPDRQPLPPRPAGGGRGGQPHAGAARGDRRRRSVHRRRPGAGRGEPGARRRACTPPGRSGCPTRPSADICGCRVRGWTGRRAPRTGASRCSPTASRWVATWRAATTAGARSPAPGRCG